MVQPPHTSPRVLIVDDEESIRRFATRAFKEAGCEVVAAADGPGALDVIEKQPPFDLFVLDVRMPEMQGDELGRRVRLRDPDAKILYFTGWSDGLFKERAVLWENEAFLEKPVSLRGLLEAASLLLVGRTDGLRVPELRSPRA